MIRSWDLDQLHKMHVRNGGGVPKEILLSKKRFMLSQPTSRPKQNYKDFSKPADAFDNDNLKGKVFGQRAWFGDGGIEYVAFIGLRGDEQLRVTRVETRSSDPHANQGYEGEHVYMPLATMYVSRGDVNTFWSQQSWDLDLPTDSVLSNCVYCFLKGVGNLVQVHATMESEKTVVRDGFGPVTGTPSDVGLVDCHGTGLRTQPQNRETQAHQSPMPGTSSASSATQVSRTRCWPRVATMERRYNSSQMPCCRAIVRSERQ